MKIERTNVTERVLEYLKSNITNGVWKSGDKISSELELVSLLQVSRVSIHNAIQQLIAVGVLESYQGKGTFVRSIPIDEIQNRLRSISENSTMSKLIEFRTIVEVECCRRIASQVSESTIDEMAACLEGMKKSRQESKKFVKYDIQFHRALLLATRNEVIVKSIDVIREEIQRQSLIHMTKESIEKALAYHEQIVNCLRARDGEGAAKALLAHLETTEQGTQVS